MFSYQIRIPKERVAILIGHKGATKRKIERKAKAELMVSSKEGDVIIQGEDNILAYTTRLVVMAIGRGFNPDIAMLLYNENYTLEILSIPFYVGKSKKRMVTIKARLIGTDGKAWKMIERLTKAHISVYGKTVGLIGQIEDVMAAKNAVESLLEGAPHGHVYKYLYDKKKKDGFIKRSR